ncbi:MAG TPA: hypothetical protein VF041_11685 [Gemmatimonadaceae bacterium]
MTTPRFRIGDAVLQQFLRDWQALLHELRMLEVQKRAATVPGGAAEAARQRVQARVGKLSDTFERQRVLFQELFAGAGWDEHPDTKRLRDLLKEIWATISRILGIGAHDPREDSIFELVQDAQMHTKAAEHVLHASVGAPEHPIITAAGVPPAVAANPLLAIAIIFDVIRVKILGRSRR